MAVRYRYDGTFPMTYLVVFHLIRQDYRVMSTSAFVNMHKYPQYVHMLGRIRKGGFDIIAYHKLDAKELPIGIEVKPEFSYIEFKHALGQTMTDLTFAFGRVRTAMIIMPHKNLTTENCLKNRINHVLRNCGCPVSMKYLSMSCKPYPLPKRESALCVKLDNRKTEDYGLTLIPNDASTASRTIAKIR